LVFGPHPLTLGPATQQVAPYLFQATQNLGGMAAAMPYVQDASKWVLDMVQGNSQPADQSGQRPSSRSSMTREYRDVRPAKNRFSFSGGEEGGASGAGSRKTSRSFSNSQFDTEKKRSSSSSSKQASPNNADDSPFERIAKYMGADFGGRPTKPKSQ
jgi:hypothetical protein